jgi:choline dehydrogenase
MPETGNQRHAHQFSSLDRLEAHYDFIVCGSGSSGSVVTGRLATKREVSVLLV